MFASRSAWNTQQPPRNRARRCGPNYECGSTWKRVGMAGSANLTSRLCSIFLDVVIWSLFCEARIPRSPAQIPLSRSPTHCPASVQSYRTIASARVCTDLHLRRTRAGAGSCAGLRLRRGTDAGLHKRRFCADLRRHKLCAGLRRIGGVARRTSHVSVLSNDVPLMLTLPRHNNIVYPKRAKQKHVNGGARVPAGY